MSANKLIQTSFVEGMECTLASLDEAKYYLEDCYTKEKIRYDDFFIVFRGRVFASWDNFHNWLIDTAEASCAIYQMGDEDYDGMWQKHKKSLTRKKTISTII